MDLESVQFSKPRPPAHPPQGREPCWPYNGPVPDNVALEDPVLMALGRWSPLDHDGLVGPAAGDDVLRRGRGGLLRKGDPRAKPRNRDRTFLYPIYIGM